MRKRGACPGLEILNISAVTVIFLSIYIVLSMSPINPWWIKMKLCLPNQNNTYLIISIFMTSFLISTRYNQDPYSVRRKKTEKDIYKR
jgi:hypothetical protein